MRNKIDLIFDWKVMGNVAYIPFIVLFLALLYSYWKYNDLIHIIQMLEFTLPVLSAWWSIYLFQDVLEEEGTELLFTYPVSRLGYGFIRVLLFFIIYLLFLGGELFIIDLIIDDSIFKSMYLQLGIQSYFFSGLGFLSMVLLRNTGWSLAVILIYTTTQVLTLGRLFPFINVFLFNKEIVPVQILLNSLRYPVILGSIFWFISQLILNGNRNFK